MFPQPSRPPDARNYAASRCSNLDLPAGEKKKLRCFSSTLSNVKHLRCNNISPDRQRKPLWRWRARLRGVGDCQNIWNCQLVPVSIKRKLNHVAARHRVRAVSADRKPRLLEKHSSIINRKFRLHYTFWLLFSLLWKKCRRCYFMVLHTLNIIMPLCSGSQATPRLFLSLWFANGIRFKPRIVWVMKNFSASQI